MKGKRKKKKIRINVYAYNEVIECKKSFYSLLQGMRKLFSFFWISTSYIKIHKRAYLSSRNKQDVNEKRKKGSWGTFYFHFTCYHKIFNKNLSKKESGKAWEIIKSLSTIVDLIFHAMWMMMSKVLLLFYGKGDGCYS